MSRDGADAIIAVNDDVGVNWLFSFLSADKKRTYCLYEAPSVDTIREAAVRAGLPADVVVEVDSIHTGGDLGVGIDASDLAGIELRSS